jgi:hypothetical protein
VGRVAVVVDQAADHERAMSVLGQMERSSAAQTVYRSADDQNPTVKVTLARATILVLLGAVLVAAAAGVLF